MGEPETTSPAASAAADAAPRVLTDALKADIRAAYAKLQANTPGFSTRRSQSQMIGLVSRALATSGGIGIAEAPTGVGKSLAYMTAGVPIALATKKKLVISTGTVAVQSQLVERDIPAFLKATGIEATVALAKGREGGSGRIEWRQQGGGYRVTLSAPVTRQSWSLLGHADGRARIDGLEGGPREGKEASMSSNRAIAYQGPGKVDVVDIDYPTFELKDGPGVNPANVGRKLPHAAILKVVTTNICGSDQHMVRGRTTAPEGLVLGHEITGEVIETGVDVEMLKKGDLVSVPFNVACGRCRTCRSMDTGVCLTVNPARAGAAYGYVDMGGWVGGQAEYVLVPYADWNLLRFPDKDRAMEKILDLTMLSDIFPTGFHGAVSAGVGPGKSVYIAGAGPVGTAAAVGAQLLGASVVIMADMNADRLANAATFGCETIDVSKEDPREGIARILGREEVDAFSAESARRAQAAIADGAFDIGIVARRP